MAPASPMNFADIHPHVTQTHILPLLDGPSLSAAATASSDLRTLCNDEKLWSDICKSTWPSIRDPRLDEIISTFPAGHRSFFEDSFPDLITEDNPHRSWCSRQPDRVTSHANRSSYPWPSQLISAVDIRYQNDIVYSKVRFTDTTTDFLSSAFSIELNEDPDSSRSGMSKTIDLKVDELSGANEATIAHLKESVTLNWIIIDPNRKRAGNISSVKPLLARNDWMTNDIHLRFATVLPGCDPTEMVQCRIEVTCGVGKGGVGLHLREVMLELLDLHYGRLSGKEFLVITERAISEENNVRRKVVGGEERERKYNQFKEMRREKMERIKLEEEKRQWDIMVNYTGILVSFVCSVYFGSLLL